MKIRKGYVANSSSSSFCIVGLDIYKEGAKAIMHRIAKLEGKKFPDNSGDYDENWDYFDYGVSPGEHVDFYGGEGELCYLGVDAKEVLEGMNLANARKWLRDMFLVWYNIEVPHTLIDLHYGEMGSG